MGQAKAAYCCDHDRKILLSSNFYTILYKMFNDADIFSRFTHTLVPSALVYLVITTVENPYHSE